MQAECIPPLYLNKCTPMIEYELLPLPDDHLFMHPIPPITTGYVAINCPWCHASVPTRENFSLHHC